MEKCRRYTLGNSNIVRYQTSRSGTAWKESENVSTLRSHQVDRALPEQSFRNFYVNQKSSIKY